MNKRLRKKKSWKFKAYNPRAVVKVDLTNVTNHSHIDIYISNKFEIQNSSKKFLLNTLQDRKIGGWPEKGYECLVNLINGRDNYFNVTVWVSESDKSYYVIRPPQINEED